jgi:hypothetical protein
MVSIQEILTGMSIRVKDNLIEQGLRENKRLLKENRQLDQRLRRINNLMIGNTRIKELDRIAMEMNIDADLTQDDEHATKLIKDALFIRRLEWDLGELHVAVKGDTARRGGRYDQAEWRGTRP